MVSGNIGKLQKKLYHFPTDNLEETLGKMNSYSSLGALKLYQASKKTNGIQAIAHASWTLLNYIYSSWVSLMAGQGL